MRHFLGLLALCVGLNAFGAPELPADFYRMKQPPAVAGSMKSGFTSHEFRLEPGTIGRCDASEIASPRMAFFHCYSFAGTQVYVDGKARNLAFRQMTVRHQYWDGGWIRSYVLAGTTPAEAGVAREVVITFYTYWNDPLTFHNAGMRVGSQVYDLFVQPVSGRNNRR